MSTKCRNVVWVVAISLLSMGTWNDAVHAAITTRGNVNPVPPAGGGTVSGTLQVGNSALGVMEIAGGTPLTNTSNATVGNGVDGIGIVTMSGFGSDWTITGSSSDITIGSSGTGSVTLENLARMQVGDDTILGVSSTGSGEINISDLGSVWDTDNVTAGQSGLGIINILNGGQLVSAGSTLGSAFSGEGRVTIADPLSQWRITGGITVGGASRGNILILDGGTLRTTSSSTIGNSSGSVGVVEVNGAGALWNAVDGTVVVGSTGTGTIHVFNGGRVSAQGILTLANTTGSRGEIWVDGLGSTLTANSIGSSVGDARIMISNGGVVTTSGFQLQQRGRMTLAGGRLKANEVFSNGGLIEGDGTIETNNFNNLQGQSVRGSIRISTDERMIFTGTLSNAGFVDLDGGELEVFGNSTNSFDIDARNGATLRFGGTGLTNVPNSQLAITAGDVDIIGNVANNQGAQILVGNGASAIFHDTLTNTGNLFVMPGSTLLALEQLNFLGNPSQLNLQIGGIDAVDERFQIEVAGSSVLEGDLVVTLFGSYQPQAGDVFPLIIAGGGLNGVFFEEDLPVLAGGLNWELVYTPNSLSLTVVESAVGGDFDNDGDVDGRDFLVWQRGGSPSPLSAGDLADWQANYGNGSIVAEAIAVPEPLTLGLLLIGGLMPFVQRVCRQR